MDKIKPVVLDEVDKAWCKEVISRACDIAKHCAMKHDLTGEAKAEYLTGLLIGQLGVDGRPHVVMHRTRQLREQVSALLSENARLRAALEKLIEASDDSDGHCYGTLSTSFVRDIARAALSAQEDASAYGLGASEPAAHTWEDA
jgi:hypothetical protein